MDEELRRLLALLAGGSLPDATQVRSRPSGPGEQPPIVNVDVPGMAADITAIGSPAPRLPELRAPGPTHGMADRDIDTVLRDDPVRPMNPLDFIPVAGDLLAGRDIVDAVGAGNLGQAALIAGASLLPFPVRKGKPHVRKAPRKLDPESIASVDHYTRQDQPTVIDPAFQGSGRAGAERASFGEDDHVPSSFFYDEGASPEPQFRGDNKVTAQINTTRILQDPEDVQKYVKLAQEQLAQEGRGGLGLTLARMERLMVEDGWEGFRGDRPGMSSVIAKFTPTDLRRGPDLAVPNATDRRIAQRTNERGGMTFDVANRRDMSGAQKWVAAPKGNEQVLGVEELTPQDVANYRVSHADGIEEAGGIIGTWRGDDGRFYLDTPHLFENEADAVVFGVRNDQQAVFDLGGGVARPITPEDRALTTERLRVAARKADADPERVFAEIEENLAPHERAQFQNQREVVMDAYLGMPASEQLLAAAAEGGPLYQWYRDSGTALGRAFGDDAPRFTALLAATSPRQSVEENLRMALEVWGKWLDAGRPTSTDAIEEVLSSVKGAGGAFRGRANNSIRALQASDAELLDPDVLRQGGLLSGEKVDAFYANLMDETQRITFDVHMIEGMGGIHKQFESGGRRLAATAAVNKAVKDLQKKTGVSIDPRAMQELTWGTLRAIRGAVSQADAITDAEGRKAVGKLLEQDLFGKTPLEASVQDAPDFAELMATNPKIAALLKDLGIKAPKPRARTPIPDVLQMYKSTEELGRLGERAASSRRQDPFFSALPFLGLQPALRKDDEKQK